MTTNEQLLSDYRDDSKFPYLSEVVYTAKDVAQMLDAAREDERKKWEAQSVKLKDDVKELVEALNKLHSSAPAFYDMGQYNDIKKLIQKHKQKQAITDIMSDDAKDGLYNENKKV